MAEKKSDANQSYPPDSPGLHTSSTPDMTSKSSSETSPPDKARHDLLRAMSSPTLNIPTIDRRLYQRSQTINSPGLSPTVVDTEITAGTSQVFVYIAPNQDPLSVVDKGK